MCGIVMHDDYPIDPLSVLLQGKLLQGWLMTICHIKICIPLDEVSEELLDFT